MRVGAHIQRKKSEAAEPELRQRRESAVLTAGRPAPALLAAALSSEGQPLDRETRTAVEPALGHDFSQVRVHSDGRAAESAQALSARAYTVGRDVVFGAGEYQPDTGEGRRLLAHELAHVAQQSATLAPSFQAQQLTLSRPDDPFEREADAAAERVVALDSFVRPTLSTNLPSHMVSRKAIGLDDEEDRRRLQTRRQAQLGAETAVAEDGPEVTSGSLPLSSSDVESAQGADLAAPEASMAATEEASSDEASGLEGASQPHQAAAQQGAAGQAPIAALQGPSTSTFSPERMPPGTDDLRGTVDEGASPAVATASRQTIETPASANSSASTPSGSTSAPARPEEDPAFQMVAGSVGGVARSQAAHAPAAQKAREASAAAIMPAAERSGLAQQGQVGAMGQAAEAQASAVAGGRAPGFDKEAFKAAIRQRIQALTPSDPKEMENFGSSNNLDEVRGDVRGQVEQSEAVAQGNVEAAASAPPDVAAVPERPGTPLPPNDAGPLPQPVDANGTVPRPAGPERLEVPLAEESVRLDNQLAEHQVTEQQLAESNEPEFQAALGMQRDAQSTAATAPGPYRAAEQERLASAQMESQGELQAGIEGMTGERGGLFEQVGELQQDARTGDEEQRAEIGRQIGAIYDETKAAVEARLQQLDQEVNSAFEAGTAAAKSVFTTYVERETAEYKRDRYNEEGDLLDRMGGEATRLWDNVTDMPEEYYDIYAHGRELYVEEMDGALDTIADVVGAGLTEAKELIADGRRQIAEFVASQPEALRGVAEQAAGNIQGRFEELERNVDSRCDQIVENMAKRYSDNLAALDAEIAAVREANKGPLQRAYEATAGVLEQIGRLKDMLLGALGGALDTVMAIIAAPVQFIGNLIDGVGQGLQNFVANIADHLQTGFIEWLTGTMGGTGIRVPETLDLPGVLDLALQVLGLAWANVRQRAVAMFGEGVVSALETGFELLVILVNEGLPGVWEWIKEKLSGLYEQVIEGIKGMLVGEVIEAGIHWLIGLLGGPAGAFVRACMMVYDIIVWFINNAQRIASLIQAVSDGARAIANGDLSAAVARVEEALARAVPTAIGFLAGLVGLNDLSANVRKVIDKIQEPINQAIDWLLNLVKGFVQKVARLLGFGENGQPSAGDADIGKEVPFSAQGESHKLYVQQHGGQATLMVASTPMTVEERLADWAQRLDTLDDAKKDQAQSLIGQARGMLSSADSSADELARKKDGVKKLEDGDQIAAADQALERQEESLANVLGLLFELFGDQPSNSSPVRKGPISDEEPATLREQLALAEAKSGQGHVAMSGDRLNDLPRLVANYGEGEWVKMEYAHEQDQQSHFDENPKRHWSDLVEDKSSIKLHWFRNQSTGINVEFKFIKGELRNTSLHRRSMRE